MAGDRTDQLLRPIRRVTECEMSYDYFVSGRWRNRDNVRVLVGKLRDKGKTVYCFLDVSERSADSYEDPEQAMQRFEAIPNWREDAYVRQVFETDMTGLKESRAVVVLLPVGKSCHIEAGVAFGLGKHLILIGEQKEAESLYLIFDEVYNDVASFLAAVVQL